MKKTATIAAAVAGALARRVRQRRRQHDAGDRPDHRGRTRHQTDPPPSRRRSRRRRRPTLSRLQGVHRLGHRWLQRPLVQRDRPCAGLDAAASTYGVQTAKVQSKADSDYADNLATLANEGCNEVTSVGFLLATDTLDAAKKNTDVDFAIIDNAYMDEKGNPIEIPANLKELTFQTDQAAYLAGYLAAGTSKSGVIGTLGGLQIPTVTIFMDGFLAGINAYNEDNSADVKLLGWDGKNGSFSSDFGDTSKCKTIAESSSSRAPTSSSRSPVAVASVRWRPPRPPATSASGSTPTATSRPTTATSC